MRYNFDTYGWLALSGFENRFTELEPPAHGAAPVVGQPWPMFTGQAWIVVTYAAPPAPPAPVPTPVYVPKDIIVERCTVEEWAKFSDPANNIPGITAEDIKKVRRIYDLFMAKNNDVNIASPRASAMGTQLVQLGVLANGQRVSEIFAPI